MLFFRSSAEISFIFILLDREAIYVQDQQVELILSPFRFRKIDNREDIQLQQEFDDIPKA